ncbi:MAG: ATP-dependent helicase [Candidatus Saccharimonadales bacterium]
MDFTARYQNLNQHQKTAVDTIDGPVMVVAGPGTGKTELLSMRAANILQKTDVLPENILCLTFTDSGSVAMQKRLSSIIGREAYNVSIYTFHAFGSDIMSRHREHFYSGAQFQPADELNQHRILTDILTALPYDNPLKTTMNGEFTAINAIKSSISDIKRSGLSADELTAVLDANDEVIAIAEPILRDVFAGRISKATFEKLGQAAAELADINEPQPIAALPRLSDTLRASLQRALAAAAEHPKITPPLTEWKKQWLTVDATKTIILKTSKQQTKLRALVEVYRLYVEIMKKAALFDYDDMIVQVVHAIETIPELRYELQEKYQYIMVDEFQDTNLAQMRILQSLTDNDANEGAPNIMVVGDDDQAIYGFQGADVGNILQFRAQYEGAKLVTLTDNYRSAPIILSTARNVITQGTERLERHIAELDKTLAPHKSAERSRTTLATLPHIAGERSWIVASIAEQIAQGVEPQEIAVLARRHADLEALLPYFADKNIPISYDKRDNVLQDEVVVQLAAIARIVQAIAENKLDETSECISQTLSHPAWNIAPEALWEVSLKAYRDRTLWLEAMQVNEQTASLAKWLIACAGASTYTPLERMLDILIGEDTLSSADSEADSFTSPLKAHFFAGQPEKYLSHLANLTAIRTKLRDHDTEDEQPRLAHFLQFLQQCSDANTSITSLRHIGDDAASVRLMSAHSSKGLEFDTVYLANAVDTNWGNKARSGGNAIAYPENLRLRKNNDSMEERLRLFFVGMTRAKRQLFISHSEQAGNGKELMLANFLVEDAEMERITPNIEAKDLASEMIQAEWYAPIVTLPVDSMRQQLASTLEHYKLSATHINNFIDVSRGGPQHFLLNNLLHFPSAYSPHASYGSAIHGALQQAHDHLKANNQPQAEEDIMRTFEQLLRQAQLTSDEFEHFHAKGIEALQTFLAEKYSTFTTNQSAELNFSHQQARLGDAQLTGKLDLADIDVEEKTILVTDYKTGSPVAEWGKGADYQKIKAHKYRQQLLFYKLLVEESRDFRNYTFVDGVLQFVEPDKAGQIIALHLGDVSEEEFDRFKQLVGVIWQHVMDLSFPDTSNYDATYKGMLAFEEDLLNGANEPAHL